MTLANLRPLAALLALTLAGGAALVASGPRVILPLPEWPLQLAAWTARLIGGAP